MYEPTADDIERVEVSLDKTEAVWREHYDGKPLVAHIKPEDDATDVAEVYTFSFGIMASIVRSTRAVRTLTRDGFGIECRPIFRSILDQMLALKSVERLGVHAVHAYGKQLAYHYSKLLDASKNGFPLGDDSDRFIQSYLTLSKHLPTTDEGKAAENEVKTFQAGNSAGTEGALLYQMWLETTPLSKPSLRLSDSYIQVEGHKSGYRMKLFLDGKPDSVVDARLVLSLLLPRALVDYATIIDDPKLGLAAIELAENAPRPSH
jgi:hypothetical protein